MLTKPKIFTAWPLAGEKSVPSPSGEGTEKLLLLEREGVGIKRSRT